jgi:hypothetical protein
MPISLLFWVLYLLALFFGIVPQWPNAVPAGSPRPYFVFGGSVLFFVLIGLLGWHDFGPPLQNR